jgi:hypothetical protein
MSETPTPADQPPEPVPGGPSAPVALLYGIAAAFQQDLGCVIGAAIFFALIIGSVVFAAQLTPCTSAAGIPCSH